MKYLLFLLFAVGALGQGLNLNDPAFLALLHGHPVSSGECTNLTDSFTGVIDNGWAVGSDSTNVYVAGRFIASSAYTVCKAKISLFSVGSPTFDLNVAVYSHDSANNIPLSQIGTMSGAVSATNVPAISAEIDFTGISSPVANGSTNWLVLFASVADPANFVTWDASTITGYAIARKPAAVWLTDATTHMLLFKLYSE